MKFGRFEYIEPPIQMVKIAGADGRIGQQGKETPAPREDGLAGLGLEHQMQPDEVPRGRQLLL